MARIRAAGRRFARPLALAAALGVALVWVGPAGAALGAPTLAGPNDGAAVDLLPAFGWNPVAGASTYEFELSADAGFNSDQANFQTKNTRATLFMPFYTLLNNGTYYWRVRAISSTGALGTWSEVRWLEMAWTGRPSLLAPDDGATLNYPADPFKLRWTIVAGAMKYSVKVATDPALGSLVWSEPIETAATTFTLSQPLSPGTYYWNVTPIDAEGHTGNPSPTASFTWTWPSTTATTFTDLASAAELVDPQFSWDPVPGAAGYEVEVNPSVDWATGSKVCCDPIRFGTPISTIGTSLSPDILLPNNTYYWRVRAVDSAGNTGVWNEGTPFLKNFDSVPTIEPPSVKNLHMADNLADAGTDVDGAAAGYQTQVPILKWDPVPGASAYQVEVTVYDDANTMCNWSASGKWLSVTTTTAWTPLGPGGANVPFPRPSDVPLANDGARQVLAGTKYCARVRPRNRDDETTIFGDFTYLDTGAGWAFEFTGYPTGGACTPSCNTGYLGANDYVTPARGSVNRRMPYFTWKPIAGKQSYFVIVAKDPNFTTIEDYAFVRAPAYAPRQGGSLTTYEDETTSYYWVVLPAIEASGDGAVGNPLDAAAAAFEKQTVAPVQLAPATGASMSVPTMFRWTPAEGARRYQLQVSDDANFASANLKDNIVTAATSYTSSTTYPSNTTLYWRVRADADDDPTPTGLTWSQTGTFQKQLPAPVMNPSNPTSGSTIPTWEWEPVPGAVSYDIHWIEADGDDKLATKLPSHAFSFAKWTGSGILRWEVRANFPAKTGGVVPGPYSALQDYAHTMPEPSGAQSELGSNRVVMSWNPRPGAKRYKVQISTRADFASFVDNAYTETTNFAPLLIKTQYTNGGRYYWRVAMEDDDRNLGDFTTPQTFALPKIMRLSASGYPQRGMYKTITIAATDATRVAIRSARVCLWGAGITTRCKYTTSLGRAAFSVRATRYGRVYVRATKSGYQTATTSLPVR
jgi:hypothetical protein